MKATQDSVHKLKEAVGARFGEMEHYINNATLFLAHLARTSRECDHVIVRHMTLLQAIRNYVYQMGNLNTHLKSYRAAFYAYKKSLFSTISSLAGGYITPQFLLPKQIAKTVRDMSDDEVLRGTKISSAIRPGFEAIYYEIQIVLEVTLIPQGISAVLGIPMNTKSGMLNIYHATPLCQPNKDDMTASLYVFKNPFLAISSNN